jgi:CheY-like chemotaxis protein
MFHRQCSTRMKYIRSQLFVWVAVVSFAAVAGGLHTVASAALQVDVAAILPTNLDVTTNRSSAGELSGSGKQTSTTPTVAEKTTARDTPVKLTVLHIDGNPDSLRMMRQLFASLQNMDLVDARTGEYGVKLATANPPSLILLDTTLPGIDGSEVLSRLRNNLATRNIPVVAVTGKSSALGIELGLTGFDDFLAKPVDAARLQAVLNRRLVNANKKPLDPATVVKQ